MPRWELPHHEPVRLALEHEETLPLGAPDDVREEVTPMIRLLGRSGGYILGPSRVIQAGTPARNILAMFDTADQAELPGASG
jgi:hypothetical protein